MLMPSEMPANNEDLHGSLPENSTVALLVIDVINDVEFEGAEALVEQAVPMAHRIAELKRGAKNAGDPGNLRERQLRRVEVGFQARRGTLSRGRRPRGRGRPNPAADDDDYFVLQPKHSAFYATTLDTLLTYLGAGTVILTGVAGNICILFSANDAYRRDLNLVVPADCVAAEV